MPFLGPRNKRSNDPATRTACRIRLFAAALLWAAVTFLITLRAGAETTAIPGRLLIKPRPHVGNERLTAKFRQHGATRFRTLRHLDVRLIALPEHKIESILTRLRRDPDIEFAERDHIARAAFVPNDPLVAGGQAWHLAQIQADRAWDCTIGRSDLLVAVLDSGIDAAHPDLIGRCRPGWNIVGNNADAGDDFGHGTAVAGSIVAAGNNTIGVAGVAFGCHVLPVKVMDATGVASYSAIAEGIRYAVDQGARVINISIVGSAASATLQEAVNDAWNHNVVIVAAAGNNAAAIPQYPAACDHVIAVAATAPGDAAASFSSYGPFITLSAPGEAIWTTQRDVNNPYGAWRGTSVASPLAAGAAALALSLNPTLSNTQLVSILERTADDLGPAGRDDRFGWGRVNAFRALMAAAAEPGALPAEPTTAPQLQIQSPADGAEFALGDVVPIEVSASRSSETAAVVQLVLLIDGSPYDVSENAFWRLDWTATEPGSHQLQALAVDDRGQCVTSEPVLVRISSPDTGAPSLATTAPVAVRTNGCGRVTPNLDGKTLEIGKVYRVKAVPAAGQVFAGWTGPSGVTDSPVLSFTMQSNLVLVARFVPSPFVPLKGNYAGLVLGRGDVLPDNSGYFNLKVTALGQFSGKLRLGGVNRGFRGRFDLAGNAMVRMDRRGLAPLDLTFCVDLANGTEQVTGSVTDGGWTSALQGDRNVFHPKWNPAVQAGSAAFALQQAIGAGTPAATGSSSISPGGAARVKGRLQDRRAFSASTALARDGDCPLYLSLSKGSEMVIGWLNFPAEPVPAANGTVLWVRTGTNAFAATLRAAGW